MSAEPQRTCPTCGNEFSGAMEFCPVCMLRKGLAGGVESGESSFEEAVKPTLEEAVQRFEHYELVKGEDGKPVELGRGAMGVTYKAFDVDLHCPVTLKVISARYLNDESARLRFLREARAAASVRHPNVASVFHLGRSGENYFYAMEFVEGETLEKLIKRSGRVEVKLALDTHPLVREYFGEQLRCQRTDAWKECNRRLYHYYRTLAPQLPDSFREMEPLFSAVICGCNAGLFREALHEVYLPRIQRGNTYFAANVLGATGPLLSVLVHFFEYGRWGSPVETSVEGQRLTAEDQLFILMQAGLYITATRGLETPEAQICYQRVESLCHSLNRPLPVSVLIGQWLYALVTDKLSATLQVAKRVYSLAQEQNDPAPMIGGYRTLASTFYFMGDFEPARQYAMRAIEIWRSGDVQSQVEQVIAPPVACLYLMGMSEWHLGETASYKVNMAGAISLAKELNDVHGLAASLFFACLPSHFERSPAKVDRLASEMIALSTRQNFALWLAAGAVLRGWARSALGNPAEGIPWIEQGIRDYQANGRMLPLPYYLGLKAEALDLAGRTPEALEAIKEAEALAERSGERWWSAELYRLGGVFLTAVGADEAQIEASFCAAIKTAKEQKSVSLAKRAEASYTEYCRQKTSASGGRGFRLPLW